uniref:Uncharacterized protein n=1 Tax=Arundo donax TaxID=35708 RepID=A0A0A9EP55_ARUDO
MAPFGQFCYDPVTNSKWYEIELQINCSMDLRFHTPYT